LISSTGDLQAIARDLVKSLSSHDVDGVVAGMALPTPDRDVGVFRIDFNPETDASGPLGRN
jgi:hypothetical protein